MALQQVKNWDEFYLNIMFTKQTCSFHYYSSKVGEVGTVLLNDCCMYFETNLQWLSHEMGDVGMNSCCMHVFANPAKPSIFMSTSINTAAKWKKLG